MRVAIKFVTCVSFVLIALTSDHFAFGQASYTATRDVSFSAFMAGTETTTGFGTTNAGVTFGFDATKHFHRFNLFDPSLEFRVGLAPGAVVSEHTYSVGLKVEHRIGRFHPYADFLIGQGTVNYNKANFSDNSVVPSYGVGLDYYLNPKWAIKVDYSRQSWKLGTETPRFNPNTLSIGISYRFNFK